MNVALSYIFQTCIVGVAYLTILVPSGYTLGWLTDIAGFRLLSNSERALWAFVLSLPLSLSIVNIVGRLCSPNQTMLILCVLGLGSLGWWTSRAAPKMVSTSELDHYTKLVLAALIIEAVYIVISGVPLQVHNRLYEPVFTGDWEIRFPLVGAARLDGVPPHNPFFTFKGQSPPLRYYYYWYSVCGIFSRFSNTSARAALLASSFYSAMTLIAVLFLCQKYLVKSVSSLRQRCAALILVCCVLGLDLIPSTLRFLFWRVRLLPEMEWWAQDRTPSLPAVILYAPHHVGGAVCGLLSFLLLVISNRSTKRSRVNLLVNGALVALAFSALVGTSTFICLFFVVSCAAFSLRRALQRSYRSGVILIIAAVLSVPVSVPYLRSMLTRAAGNNRATSTHFAVIKLRDNDFAHSLMTKWALVHHRPEPTSPKKYLYRIPIIICLYISELGFFLAVVIEQFSSDFRRGARRSVATESLWILAGCLSLFFFFFSSEELQRVNDLGLQAGLVLRLVLMLWGAAFVCKYWMECNLPTVSTFKKWALRVTIASFLIGLSGSVWQAVVERTYAVFADYRVLPAISPFPYAYHIGAVYLDIYKAQQFLGSQTPAEAVIQSNPEGRYQTIFRLYQERRQAAGDSTCVGAFGGDPELCQNFAPRLLRLFGSHAPLPDKRMRSPKPSSQDMTMSAFGTVCAEDDITAFSASRADPVWYDRQSWVWLGQPIFVNTNVRVIRCPSK